MMKQQEIIIFDFDTHYPRIDSPLEALLLSLLEAEDYRSIVYTCNALTVEFAQKHAIPYVYIKKVSSRHIYTLYVLIKVLRKKHAIFHAFGTRAVDILVPLYHRWGKGKLICTFTDLPQVTSIAKLQKQYRNVASVTAPTRHFLNAIAHVLHIPQSKLSVIPIGVTTELYTNEHIDQKGRLIFTVVAPLESGSSLLEVLDSLSVLHKANILPDWEVRFIGSGPLFSSLIEHATHIGIVDRIALLGDYPLPELLQRTTVLILPVFFWYVSQAIYAGILSGTPIVHTKDANVLDIVNFHHKDTASFTQGDSVEIRSAIKYVLESQQTIHAPVYSLEQTVNAFHVLYRRIS